MLAKIRKNITKKLEKKMKGFLMIQTALALITLGAMAVSFFQIYGGQFAAMAAARSSHQAQQALDLVTEYYQMVDYDSLTSASVPKSGTLATLFGAGNVNADIADMTFTCSIGAEKSFTTSDGTNSGNLRLATINVMNSGESAPRATVTVPLSSAGVGGYYVKNDTKKTAGIMGIQKSGSYLYGYVNGTQYPFYADAYRKSETYTRSQLYTKSEIDALLAAVKGDSLPVGTILPFNGTKIPDGWALCNGSNGTPNLIGRFLEGGSSAGGYNSSALPNIKGSYWTNAQSGASYPSVTTKSNGAITTKRTGEGTWVGGSSKVSFFTFSIDAHDSNPIYQDGWNKVQPDSYVVMYIIKIK